MPQNDSSKNSSQKNTRSDRDFHQKSASSGQNQPSDKNFNIIEFLNKKVDTIKDRYGYGKSAKRRCPHYYFVNNKNTVLIVLQGDITRTKVDAIVNAANEHMTGGGGVDGIIHRAAGRELYEACSAHKQIFPGVRLPTGHSRILLSYNMSSTTNYIINTAGPIYSHYKRDECAKELTSCYKTALDLANLYDLESIAFTAISCGIFGYPANDGATTALETVDKHAGSVPIVVFVLWDDDIYDTWVKIAEKFNFEEFDILNIPPPTASDNNDDQRDALEDSNKKSNQPESPLATSSTTKPPSDEVKEKSIVRLPSAPDSSSDTQQTEDMGTDSQTDADQRLHTQQTVQMTSFNEGSSDTGVTEMKSTSDQPDDSSANKQKPDDEA